MSGKHVMSIIPPREIFGFKIQDQKLFDLEISHLMMSMINGMPIKNANQIPRYYVMCRVQFL